MFTISWIHIWIKNEIVSFHKPLEYKAFHKYQTQTVCTKRPMWNAEGLQVLWNYPLNISHNALHPPSPQLPSYCVQSYLPTEQAVTLATAHSYHRVLCKAQSPCDNKRRAPQKHSTSPSSDHNTHRNGMTMLSVYLYLDCDDNRTELTVQLFQNYQLLQCQTAQPERQTDRERVIHKSS